MPKKTEFETKAEARVAIAKDVIKWVKTGRLYANKGSYVEYDDEEWLITDQQVKDSADLKTVLSDKKCSVCALGACFVATVDRFNKIGCDDLGIHVHSENLDYGPSGVAGLGDSHLRKYLHKYFSESQLSLIECAFECSPSFSGASASNRLKASDYSESGNKYDEDELLIAIMRNIIKNKGTFKP